MNAVLERPGPIFIGGPDRCGKTLLAAMLGSHSRVAIPIVGSNLWTYFYGQFGDLRDDRSLDRCLAALQGYKHARFLGLDLPRLRDEFRSRDRTYASLFGLVHEHFAERQGKPRWGDQTGLIERYAEEIYAAHPDARMIQMVRDPRDRYEASIRLWPKGRARAGGAVARWRYSVELGRSNLARYGSRYLMVRYENLVQDPRGIMTEVSAFVGERFEPRMLQMPDAPTYRAKLIAGGGSPSKLISAEHVGDYRGRIPVPELAFIQGRLAALMRSFGYEPDPIGLRAVQRLRYAIATWPMNSLTMKIWDWREALQHRFPGRLGRRPVASKLLLPATAGGEGAAAIPDPNKR
jgi:hypothetical protein